MRLILTLVFTVFLTLPSIAKAQTYKNGLINSSQEAKVFHRLTGMSTKFLKDAFDAYDCAILGGYAHKKGIYTIVDYQLPSFRRRLMVLDLNHNKVLFDTYAAHGSGSGGIYPTYFSNVPNSWASSLGLFKTGQSYYGRWGYAMKLYGLENGFNNNVYKRAIVLHSGSYVSQSVVKHFGKVGWSHGCIVVPVALDHRIINLLRGGSLIFAYYPEKAWLKTSKFLHCPMPKPHYS